MQSRVYGTVGGLSVLPIDHTATAVGGFAAECPPAGRIYLSIFAKPFSSFFESHPFYNYIFHCNIVIISSVPNLSTHKNLSVTLY